MKLLNQGQEFIPSLKELSLDDLYKNASQLGEVKIGGILGPDMASIDCNFTGDDFVMIKCRKYPDVKQNLAEAIERAMKLREFYKHV